MNNVLTQEVLHQIRIRKIKGLLFKIDIKKIFNRVHWDFLIELLEGSVFSS
jgi:hypothetical protein